MACSTGHMNPAILFDNQEKRKRQKGFDATTSKRGAPKRFGLYSSDFSIK
jgi:hypothetical protein